MPCRLEWATTPENYRMTTIDATLRHALEVSGRDLILTLDPALQGLPETAHGGSVLAVFDALAGAPGLREVAGLYRRRVPLGLPLTLRRAREDSAEAFVLSEPAGRQRGRASAAGVACVLCVRDRQRARAPRAARIRRRLGPGRVAAARDV